MTRNLYVAGQDRATRRWFPIGMLIQQVDGFKFLYTDGAKEAVEGSNFSGLQSIRYQAS